MKVQYKIYIDEGGIFGTPRICLIANRKEIPCIDLQDFDFVCLCPSLYHAMLEIRRRCDHLRDKGPIKITVFN